MSKENKNLVTLSVDNHIAEVKLNRPEKYNALNPAMIEAIIDTGRALRENEDVRAVILSGEGAGFCAGLDMEAFQGMRSASAGETSDSIFLPVDGSHANMPQYTAYVWKEMPVPVIAALDGVAYGGGLQIALGADIRIASPTSRLSVMEIKWGLIPDMSFTQTIRDILPLDVAKELMFTGRVISADEALKLGLVTRIADDPHAQARLLAEEIASKNPDAVRAAKALVELAWHSDVAEGLALEEKLQFELIGSPNQREAVRAVFEKRPAEFS